MYLIYNPNIYIYIYINTWLDIVSPWLTRALNSWVCKTHKHKHHRNLTTIGPLHHVVIILLATDWLNYHLFIRALWEHIKLGHFIYFYKSSDTVWPNFTVSRDSGRFRDFSVQFTVKLDIKRYQMAWVVHLWSIIIYSSVFASVSLVKLQVFARYFWQIDFFW